ncbi:MAG: NYN domain-containing protein [Nitrospirae bacterium]|nr:NYN domain-containing protein [Nitrospirota bacterium]
MFCGPDCPYGESSCPEYLLYYHHIYIRSGAISSIIIDGYNLIGTQHRDLQKQREGLIRQLIAYRKLRGHDITIVFDGWKSGSHNQEQTITGGIRIIYSRLGDKADEVIKTMIGQVRKEWIVITSDREIMDHAWKNHSVPVPSDQFLRLLEQSIHRNLPQPLLSKEGSMLSGHDTKCDYEPLEDDEDMPQKGNPRQPSKKEKALMRVLKKL